MQTCVEMSRLTAVARHDKKNGRLTRQEKWSLDITKINGPSTRQEKKSLDKTGRNGTGRPGQELNRMKLIAIFRTIKQK